MPSVSKKQHNFMEAIAHSPEFAKKAGVPQSVGKDFAKADKGKTFKKGGIPPSINKQKTHHGAMQMPNASLNKYIGHKDGGITKGTAMNKSDMNEDTSMDMAQDKTMIKKAFAQHDAQEHTGGKGTTLNLKSGGSASFRADGIATQGKTKGRII